MAEIDSQEAVEFLSGEVIESSDEIKEKKETEKKADIDVESTEVKTGSLFSIVLVSALAVIMLGAVIYSLDRRNTMYNRVSELNSELNLAQAENVRLQSELDSKMSAKNVEDYAENVLGMQRIDSSQIQYIEIQTDDVVNIPEQDESLLAKFKRFFDNCVEYFRG